MERVGQVTDVVAPYGGYPKIVKQGINNDYLPVWLQSAGYNTYYVGKLWNQHSVLNYHSPHAAGFNGSDFLLDPFTYQYYSAHMSRNGGPPVSYEGQYSPDVTADKANGFLREALERPDEPFFLVHAPVAPHADFKFVGGVEITEPKYAPRHAHLFKDYVIPRDDESFNPKEQGGPAWIRDLPLLNDTVLAYNDEFQRARLRALQAVDEMVEQAVRILDEAGQLDSTYIIFTADNGYHISQHRMNPGKECGYETDVRVPFVVRGPGIAAGRISDAVTSHTDIASTILRLAGAPPSDTDGQPIPLTQEEEAGFRAEHVTLEHWGPVIPEGKYGDYGGGFGLPHGPGEETLDGSVMDFYTALRSTNVKPLVSSRNSTFKAIRVIGEQYNLYYAVWCTNETELYDHTVRPIPLPFPHPFHQTDTRSTDRPRPDPQPPVPLAPFSLCRLPPRRPAARARHPAPRRFDAGPKVVQGRDVHRPVADAAPTRRRALAGRQPGRAVRRLLRGATKSQLREVRDGVHQGCRGADEGQCVRRERGLGRSWGTGLGW